MNTKNTSETSSRTFSLYNRWKGLIGGILAGGLLTAAGVYLLVAYPASEYSWFVLGFGVLLLILSVVLFLRQQTGASGDPSKTTYQDGTGNAVQFAPVTTAPVTETFAGEHASDILVPVMANGLKATEVAGRSTLHNQENAVILTEHYLLALQIPVTEGEGASEGLGGIAATLLSSSGMGANDKNTVTAGFMGGAVAKTVDEMVASKSLSDIMREYHSYAIPLGQVASSELTSLGNISVTLTDGTSYSWGCMNRERRDAFVEALRQRGLLRP